MHLHQRQACQPGHLRHPADRLYEDRLLQHLRRHLPGPPRQQCHRLGAGQRLCAGLLEGIRLLRTAEAEGTARRRDGPRHTLHRERHRLEGHDGRPHPGQPPIQRRALRGGTRDERLADGLLRRLRLAAGTAHADTDGHRAATALPGNARAEDAEGTEHPTHRRRALHRRPRAEHGGTVARPARREEKRARRNPPRRDTRPEGPRPALRGKPALGKVHKHIRPGTGRHVHLSATARLPGLPLCRDIGHRTGAQALRHHGLRRLRPDGGPRNLPVRQ